MVLLAQQVSITVLCLSSQLSSLPTMTLHPKKTFSSIGELCYL